jgi:hypothetical protein
MCMNKKFCGNPSRVVSLNILQFVHFSMPRIWALKLLSVHSCVSAEYIRPREWVGNWATRSADEEALLQRLQTGVRVYLSVVWIWCPRLTRTDRNTRVALRLVVSTKLRPEPVVPTCRDQVTILERFSFSTSLYSRQILQVIVTDQSKTCPIHIPKQFI